MINLQRIDKNKARPLYLQLMDIIISSIEAGEYKAEEKLPSERDLCKELSLSRSTVRQAIRELEIEGYVYKQHGRGTFVSPEKYRQDLLKFYSFTAEMKRIGKKPSSKVLNFEIVEPFNNIKQIMNLKDGDRTYRFTRLRLADEMPMMLEVSYIPEKRVKDLSKEDLENNPMYYLFKNKYNIELTGATETFQSVLTNKNEADILKYREGLASMMIERVTYEDKSVIEYTKSIARGDKFKYHVMLKR